MHPNDTMSLKICTKCGEAKPATHEYFVRHRRYKDGLDCWCKDCSHNQSRIYAAAHRERKAQYDRQYHVANREKRLEHFREYRRANAERVANQKRVYVAAHRAHVNEYHRVYYANNRERLDESVRIYRSIKPHVIRAIRRRRRARERNAEGSHTASDIASQYERQKGRCYWCGVKVGDSYHVDHIVPLARGGSDWPDNLVIACPHCNTSKQDKLPSEWPEGGRLL